MEERLSSRLREDRQSSKKRRVFQEEETMSF